MNGIEKVVSKAGGSPTAVAAKLDSAERRCQRQHVEYWLRKGYVPGTWAPQISTLFEVPLHELNPNIYPAPREVA